MTTLQPRQLPALRVHGVNATVREKVSRIAETMRAGGWNGPALLVEESETGFYAWTGSHRIEAAKLAEIPVQCLVLGREDADASFLKHYPDRYGFTCWRDYASRYEGPSDYDRLRALDRVGLTEASKMLGDEIQRQDDALYEHLKEEIDVARRRAPLLYRDWMSRLRTGKEGPEHSFDMMLRNDRIWVVKMKYFDASSQRFRVGLFERRHHDRVRGDVTRLRPILSLEAAAEHLD